MTPLVAGVCAPPRRRKQRTINAVASAFIRVAPNTRTQARRASEARHGTETLSRRCLKCAGWAASFGWPTCCGCRIGGASDAGRKGAHRPVNICASDDGPNDAHRPIIIGDNLGTRWFLLRYGVGDAFAAHAAHAVHPPIVSDSDNLVTRCPLLCYARIR